MSANEQQQVRPEGPQDSLVTPRASDRVERCRLGEQSPSPRKRSSERVARVRSPSPGEGPAEAGPSGVFASSSQKEPASLHQNPHQHAHLIDQAVSVEGKEVVGAFGADQKDSKLSKLDKEEGEVSAGELMKSPVKRAGALQPNEGPEQKLSAGGMKSPSELDRASNRARHGFPQNEGDEKQKAKEAEAEGEGEGESQVCSGDNALSLHPQSKVALSVASEQPVSLHLLTNPQDQEPYTFGKPKSEHQLHHLSLTEPHAELQSGANAAAKMQVELQAGRLEPLDLAIRLDNPDAELSFKLREEPTLLPNANTNHNNATNRNIRVNVVGDEEEPRREPGGLFRTPGANVNSSQDTDRKTPSLRPHAIVEKEGKSTAKRAEPEPVSDEEKISHRSKRMHVEE